MSKTYDLSLFDAFGIELEYMIVDRDTLAVKPIADLLFEDLLGHEGNEFEMPVISLSNELALHIVELKTTMPTQNLQALRDAFYKTIQMVNEHLQKWNARLMPTAAHPWMDPLKETRLWAHENAEIYQTYDKIFDCKGHGWSNLQSTHINLPFGNDEEFGRLHAAIRLLLPILPCLAASSPVLNGKLTGLHDTRLDYYRKNQRRIPSICGMLIPEQVWQESDYRANIYNKIEEDLIPFDPQHILDPVWVNSRGAIARFDRGAIEIRTLDLQECAAADLAIATLVIEILKLLVNEDLISYKKQKMVETEKLAAVQEKTIQKAEKAVIDDQEYLRIFGMQSSYRVRGVDIWSGLLDLLIKKNNRLIEPWKVQLTILFDQGSLSSRIIKALQFDSSHEQLKWVYDKLAKCLQYDQMFLV
jgi:carboxylate-amine ligase